MPSMNVAFYTTYEQNNVTWASSNFHTLVSRDNTYAPQTTQICFRVANMAQAIIHNIEIPASNLQVSVKTNVKCTDCNLNVNVGKLAAQDSVPICKNVYVSTNTTELKFTVVSTWNALVLSPNQTNNFICEKTGDVNYKNDYHCNF